MLPGTSEFRCDQGASFPTSRMALTPISLLHPLQKDSKGHVLHHISKGAGISEVPSGNFHIAIENDNL